MAHNSGNTQIFTKTENGVKYGVEVYDLQVVLGIGIYNDFGGLITYGAANNKINKWAKYKPLRSNKLGILSDSERKTLKQGLVITKYTSLSALVAGYANDYVYQAPRGKGQGSGGADEWFRPLDFAATSDNLGYDKEAMCPVAAFQGVTGEVTTGTPLIVRLYLNPSNQVPSGSILTSDLDPDNSGNSFSDFYFGVIIRTGTSSTYRIITMSTTVGTGYPTQELALNLAANLFSQGNSYTLYPVFARNSVPNIQQGGSYTTGLYSVPNTEPTTFSVVTIARVVSVGITNFSASVGVGRYTWSITAAMQINSGTTITGEIIYRIYEGQSASGTPVASGTFYYGQIAVAPDQTIHTESGVVRGSTPSYITAVLSYQGTDYLPVTIAIE